MPRRIAVNVKEKRPEVMEKTTEWAHDIWDSLDWQYEVIPKDNISLSSHCKVKVVPSNQKLMIVNLKGMKQNKSDKSKVDKSKIQCYMCHKMGHYSPNARKPVSWKNCI